jgi:hypothetical protein
MTIVVAQMIQLQLRVEQLGNFDRSAAGGAAPGAAFLTGPASKNPFAPKLGPSAANRDVSVGD